MNSKLSINSAAKQTNTNRLLLFSFYQKGKLLCFDLYGCFQWIFIQSGSDIKTTTRTCTPSTRMLRWTKFVTTFLSLLPGSVCWMLAIMERAKETEKTKLLRNHVEKFKWNFQNGCCVSFDSKCELYVHSVNGFDTVERTKPNEWHNSDRQQWEFAVRMADNCGRIRFFCVPFRSVVRPFQEMRKEVSGSSGCGKGSSCNGCGSTIRNTLANEKDVLRKLRHNGNGNLCVPLHQRNELRSVCTFSFCSFAHIILSFNPVVSH